MSTWQLSALLFIAIQSSAAIPDLDRYDIKYSASGSVESKGSTSFQWNAAAKTCELRLPGKVTLKPIAWAKCESVQTFLKKNWSQIETDLSKSKSLQALQIELGAHTKLAELRLENKSVGVRRAILRICDGNKKNCRDMPHTKLDELGVLIRSTVAENL